MSFKQGKVVHFDVVISLKNRLVAAIVKVLKFKSAQNSECAILLKKVLIQQKKLEMCKSA